MRAPEIGSAAEAEFRGNPTYCAVWTLHQAGSQPSVFKADPCVHFQCLYIYPAASRLYILSFSHHIQAS